MVGYKVVMPYKDPEARAAYRKQYNKDHREENKQYAKDHREEKKQYDKQYRKDNIDKIKKYYDKNKIILNAKKRKYMEVYMLSHRDDKRKYDREHTEMNLKSKIKELTALGEINNLTYMGFRYAIMSWSKTVRNRDNNKCTWCNSTKTLVSHHIWHKQWCPESSLDVDNGITLCHECHMEQHRLDKL